MTTRKLATGVCFATVFALALSAGTLAIGDPHQRMYLTFNQPVALPGVALGAGTYIFEIANPDISADIVRVLSRDRTRAYFMGFTRLVTRPNSLPRTQRLSLAETASGAVPPITVWWPDRETSGRQFVYETR